MELETLQASSTRVNRELLTLATRTLALQNAGGGPSEGIGGIPDTPGEDCDPLGNVLIAQEPGTDMPDDNVVDGRIIVFTFDEPAQYVYEIGILDADYDSTRRLEQKLERLY